MFYFFQRGPDFVRCEISDEQASGYRVIVTQPDGTERPETSTTSDAADARFLEIEEQLKSEGWWGRTGGTSAPFCSLLEHEIPTSKFQIPTHYQPQPPNFSSCLAVATWECVGAWDLELGI